MKKVFITCVLSTLIVFSIGCKKNSNPAPGGGGIPTTSNTFSVSSTGDPSGTYNGVLLTSYASSSGQVFQQLRLSFILYQQLSVSVHLLLLPLCLLLRYHLYIVTIQN